MNPDDLSIQIERLHAVTTYPDTEVSTGRYHHQLQFQRNGRKSRELSLFQLKPEIIETESSSWKLVNDWFFSNVFPDFH